MLVPALASDAPALFGPDAGDIGVAYVAFGMLPTIIFIFSVAYTMIKEAAAKQAAGQTKRALQERGESGLSTDTSTGLQALLVSNSSTCSGLDSIRIPVTLYLDRAVVDRYGVASLGKNGVG